MSTPTTLFMRYGTLYLNPLNAFILAPEIRLVFTYLLTYFIWSFIFHPCCLVLRSPVLCFSVDRMDLPLNVDGVVYCTRRGMPTSCASTDRGLPVTSMWLLSTARLLLLLLLLLLATASPAACIFLRRCNAATLHCQLNVSRVRDNKPNS